MLHYTYLSYSARNQSILSTFRAVVDRFGPGRATKRSASRSNERRRSLYVLEPRTDRSYRAVRLVAKELSNPTTVLPIG
jgi:hypothetical protein